MMMWVRMMTTKTTTMTTNNDDYVELFDTVGQLLTWAWVYSTLHPFGVGK